MSEKKQVSKLVKPKKTFELLKGKAYSVSSDQKGKSSNHFKSSYERVEQMHMLTQVHFDVVEAHHRRK